MLAHDDQNPPMTEMNVYETPDQTPIESTVIEDHHTAASEELVLPEPVSDTPQPDIPVR